MSIYSLLYVAEIERSIRKIYELIGEGGMAIIAMSPKRKPLNEPNYHVARRLYGQTPYYDEDTQKVLTEFNIPFRQEKIEFLVNITECFKQDSELRTPLLNFIVGAKTADFSPLQLQLLLDYFESCGQKMEVGEIMLPHFGVLFYISCSKSKVRVMK